MIWEELVALAKKLKQQEDALPPLERAENLRAQRISWVYGNCKMSNPNVTMQMVEEAYDRRYGIKPKAPESPCNCCDRADEYNGFGSDGPTIFTCPKGCGCHD